MIWILFCFQGTLANTNVDVNDHLEKGKQLLAAGQLSDALSHFHSAIGRIKENSERKFLMNILDFFRC